MAKRTSRVTLRPGFDWLGALLGAIQLSAVTAVICGLFEQIIPGWNSLPLALASGIISFEAAFAVYLGRRERMIGLEVWSFLGLELLMLLLLMRVVAILSWPLSLFAEDLQRWLRSPLSFFDTYYGLLLLLGLLFALVAHHMASDMRILAPQLSDTPDQADEHRRALSMAGERNEAVQHMNTRFVGGGVLLLLALAAQAIDFRVGATAPRPLGGTVVAWSLAYVISGFLLHSQASLNLLRSRWQSENARVAPNVTRSWGWLSLLLVALLALLALLPPRAAAIGLLDTLRGLFGIVAFLLQFVGYLLFWLAALLALIPLLLLSLLPFGGSTNNPPPAPPQFQPPLAPPAAAAEPALWPALVFWACILLLCGLGVRAFLQRHPVLLGTLQSWGPLRWLLAQLLRLFADLRNYGQSALELLRERLRSHQPTPHESQPRLNLRRLAPRELLRYLYHSTLQRAEQAGMSRKRNQTPYEYEHELAAHLPEEQAEIKQLTAAFVEAEYTPHEIDATRVAGVRKAWQKLRDVLRGRRATIRKTKKL